VTASRRWVTLQLALAWVLVTSISAASSPAALALGDEVRQVSAGTQYSCALRTDGTVWCWGSDHHGQLGDGTTGDPTTHLRLSPVQVRRGGGFLTGITAISAGDVHSCARRADSTVWCWGDDASGQLGDGTTGDPATHLRLKAVRVRHGTGFLTGVSAVSAGHQHACARRADSTVWCWGDDEFGQLGDGTTGDLATHLRLSPVRVRRGGDFLTGVSAVSVGDFHSCARRVDGTAWCWGDGESGQLGDGTTGAPTTQLRLKAVQVRRGGGFLTGVSAVSAGDQHSCARRADGTAWCWGDDASGQLGDGTTGDAATHLRLKAVQVRRAAGILTGVTAVSAGGDHSCALRANGTARCWGADGYGQLGDGTTGDPTTHLRLKAVQVRRAGGPLTGVTGVSAGGYHGCARREKRTAWCWGNDELAQLGDGGADSVPHPFATAVAFP
jgi:alpha-tubulin suppressor-like RCC1 family protein